jgi:hypothetical protein
MSFGGELETVVTLSPLPHLLGLLDSAPPYPNLSSLGQKPNQIPLQELKILSLSIQRIKTICEGKIHGQK